MCDDPKSTPRIKVTLVGYLAHPFLIFDDWFDFADFIKQLNESGHNVTISKWEYMR